MRAWPLLLKYRSTAPPAARSVASWLPMTHLLSLGAHGPTTLKTLEIVNCRQCPSRICKTHHVNQPVDHGCVASVCWTF